MAEQTKEKVLLIDGHSIINRAFYGLPDLTNSEGLHTGAVYGFLNILLKTIEEEQPAYLAVAFDVHAPTFRHRMYEAYKGTRKPMPQELREQVPLLQEMLAAMNIPIITREGFEADDILGTLARQMEREGRMVTILSGDRDLLQLATDRVKIRMPKTSRGQTAVEDYFAQDVLARYQITPLQIIDLKALMGDASDNIPGIPGVGEKTASRLIRTYGSIENAHDHLEEVMPKKARESLRDHYDMAELSKRLATIDTDAPVSITMTDAVCEDLFTERAYELCLRLEFKNLLGRFAEDQIRQDPLPTEDGGFVIEDEEGLDFLIRKLTGPEFSDLPLGISLLSEGKEVFGLALYAGENQSWYLPVCRSLGAKAICDAVLLLSAVRILCCMDVKKMLKHVPVREPGRVFDVSVAAYLLNPLKSEYTYDGIAKDYLGGRLLTPRENLLGKKTLDSAFRDADENLSVFAGLNAYAAYSCREPLCTQLKEQGMWKIYEEIEAPLIFVLDAMEKAGVRVKGEELSEYGRKLEKRIRELEDSVTEKAGESFNLNSPRQLGVILFEKLGLPGGKKTKTGYSTSADVLEKLAPDYPIVKELLEYRQLAKLKSTYADGLTGQIGADGRVHSTFQQTVTATGRLSSTDPNLQNIPVRMELGREIRKVFVPEDGYVFLDADYSQIELRVLAHMSGDPQLIEAYRQAQDIHAITASQVFHVPLEEVTPQLRRNAKAVNFGIVYGISSFGLSQDLSISRKEAQDYIERYFSTYPGIRRFLDEAVKKGKEEGYVTTLYGRRRPVPELSSSNFMQRSFGERIAMNSPVQGTAADIIKTAMNRVHQELRERGLKSRLVLQVHDELLIETWKDEIDEVGEILMDQMKHAADLAVPLEVDMHQGSSWYEAH